MNFDHIVDSSTPFGAKQYPLDINTKRPTTVFFEKEGVILTANADGTAIFSNTDGEILYKTQAGGKQHLFSRIQCNVCRNTIHVTFLIVVLIDNYPHCDGEYDRWDEKIIGEVPIFYPNEA
ncbi:MAG: hypothetical protein E7604_12370 [Ruminococcaceae bacterium]|nr:hypothetical protein [Oscillospiraceae bacterium]